MSEHMTAQMQIGDFFEAIREPTLKGWETFERIWLTPEQLWLYRYSARGARMHHKECPPSAPAAMLIAQARRAVSRFKTRGPKGRLP